MPVDLDNVSTASGEASVSSSGNQTVPPKSTAKKKRNLPGMPGTSKNSTTICFSSSFSLILFLFYFIFHIFGGLFRSRCRGDCSVSEDPFGHKPIRVRNLQQGVPEGSEPAAPSKGSQPSVEAEAEVEQGGEEEGLRVPRANVRSPRPFKGSR